MLPFGEDPLVDDGGYRVLIGGIGGEARAD